MAAQGQTQTTLLFLITKSHHNSIYICTQWISTILVANTNVWVANSAVLETLGSIIMYGRKRQFLQYPVHKLWEKLAAVNEWYF